MNITNSHVMGVAGAQLNQTNAVMGVTKRHAPGDSTSSKWLPQVSHEKKSRPGNHKEGAATTIQIGMGEIHLTNQAQSPGPSSIKMYGSGGGGVQHQQPHLRVTNQVGQTSAAATTQAQYVTLQDHTRASIQLNQANRQKLNAAGGGPAAAAGGKNAARRNGGGSTDLQYKLQLPDIMQQQQNKIN